jgi:hypothetical protein
MYCIYCGDYASDCACKAIAEVERGPVKFCGDCGRTLERCDGEKLVSFQRSVNSSLEQYMAEDYYHCPGRDARRLAARAPKHPAYVIVTMTCHNPDGCSCTEGIVRRAYWLDEDPQCCRCGWV